MRGDRFLDDFLLDDAFDDLFELEMDDDFDDLWLDLLGDGFVDGFTVRRVVRSTFDPSRLMAAPGAVPADQIRGAVRHSRGVFLEGATPAEAEAWARAQGYTRIIPSERHQLPDGRWGRTHIHGVDAQGNHSGHIYFGTVPPTDFFSPRW